MNTYIPADKLIAEIEFAKSVYSNPNRVVHGIADAFRQDGRAAMCDDILKKIDSLQQEQPDNEDIDKVAQELYEHLYELKRRNNVPTNLYDKQEIIALWKAGIEYAYNHPKQEKRVDLEKAFAHEYAIYQLPNFIIASIVDGTELIDFIYKTARHFYELGKSARKEETK